MVVPVGENSSSQMLRRYKKESDDAYAVKDLFPVRFVPLLPDIASSEENADDTANEYVA